MIDQNPKNSQYFLQKNSPSYKKISIAGIKNAPIGNGVLPVAFLKKISGNAKIIPKKYAKNSAKIRNFHPKIKPMNAPSSKSPSPTHFPCETKNCVA